MSYDDRMDDLAFFVDLNSAQSVVESQLIVRVNIQIRILLSEDQQCRVLSRRITQIPTLHAVALFEVESLGIVVVADGLDQFSDSQGASP